MKFYQWNNQPELFNDCDVFMACSASEALNLAEFFRKSDFLSVSHQYGDGVDVTSVVREFYYFLSTKNMTITPMRSLSYAFGEQFDAGHAYGSEIKDFAFDPEGYLFISFCDYDVIRHSADIEKGLSSDELQQAVEYAVKCHASDCRKGTDIPYIVHPVEVMKIVCELTHDTDVRIAAVLHDTVEDTSATIDEIKYRFGSHVAELVAAESENKRDELPGSETWKIRKQETINKLSNESLEIKIICLGDKLSNMRDIEREYSARGMEFWAKFNAPSNGNGLSGKMESIGWYYRSVADMLEDDLGGTKEFQELESLINKVFA